MIKELSGMALFNGIRLEGDDYRVTTIKQKDGSLYSEVEKLNNQECKSNWISNTPFIRGICFYIGILLNSSKFIKFTLITTLSLLVTSTGVDIFNNGSFSIFTNNSISTNLGVALIVLCTCLLIVLILRFTKITSYHGVEHMIITAYEKQIPITTVTVSEQSRVHKRCGTNLAVIMIILYSLFISFGIIPLISLTLSMMIGAELYFSQSKVLNKLISPIYHIAYAVQYLLTTKKPKYEDIMLAIHVLNKLKEYEGDVQ